MKLFVVVLMTFVGSCWAAGRSPEAADNNLCTEKLREEIREEKRKAPLSTPYGSGVYNATGDPCTTYCQLVTAAGAKPRGQYQTPDYLTCAYLKYCKSGKCVDLMSPKGGSTTVGPSTTMKASTTAGPSSTKSGSTTPKAGSSTPSPSTTAKAGSSTPSVSTTKAA